MNVFGSEVHTWLAKTIGSKFSATKHVHSHQDEVYRIKTPHQAFYLKISTTLQAERDNLLRLQPLLSVPAVIDFATINKRDYLLLSELPGKNLVELIGEWPNDRIVSQFATAVKDLHHIDILKVFPDQAHTGDVLLHGDMALPNILISDDGTVGYIDFGQMSFGPLDLDLADALWSLQRNIGPTYGEQFLKEYGLKEMSAQVEKALEFRYEPSSD